MAVTWLYLPLTLSRLGLRNLGMWAWAVHLRYKRFSRKSAGVLAEEETLPWASRCNKLHFTIHCELPDVQAGFRKGRGTRDQIANIHWIINKAREFRKNIYFCFIDYAKAFDCAHHNKLWEILKEMGIPDHLTCILINLYVGQEATVRTDMEKQWFQIGKGVCQGCILSPCLFNLYAEYIMRNAGLEEAQAGIKIARRNINNLWYADDTTLMAESEEELKTSWWKWKRREKKFA